MVDTKLNDGNEIIEEMEDLNVNDIAVQNDVVDGEQEIGQKDLMKEEQPTNELTQTDHLNKKLLQAFLTKINSSNPGQNLSIDNSDQSEWAGEDKRK